MKKAVAAVLTLLFTFSVLSRQSAANPPPTSDELSQGLWWLYHLRYDKSIEIYDHYIAAHPDDPAGYFYKAAADWWHLAQEFEYDQPDIQKRFDASVDLTLVKAQGLATTLDAKNPEEAKRKALAYLYWGGAEGLRGRWLVTQKRWAKAYFAGRDGFNFLKKAVALDPTLYDAYMGIGTYDYFSDTLSGFMGFLSAIFVRGDRHRGIREIEVAIEKGTHARVESQVFLGEIYIFEEKQPQKGIALATALRQEFPQSPLMHLMLITALYQDKQWDRVEEEAQDYFLKSQSGIPWYNTRGVPPALYCLGMADLWGHHDLEKALEKFNRIIEDARASPKTLISRQ